MADKMHDPQMSYRRGYARSQAPSEHQHDLVGNQQGQAQRRDRRPRGARADERTASRKDLTEDRQEVVRDERIQQSTMAC